MATKKSSLKPAKKRSSLQPAKKARKAEPKRNAPARKATAKESLKFTSASPSFTVDDLERSLAWYIDVVGFSMGERWERDGKLMGAELSAGGVTVMIGQDDWKKGRDRKKGEGFRIYLETRQDLDALAEAIESRGGMLDSRPEDTSWGSRVFTLTDPDGFKITIATPAK
jgi:uncharacterized glyoxalase superfamily protein PhnB